MTNFVLVMYQRTGVHASPRTHVALVGLFPRVCPSLVHDQFVRAGEALAADIADVGTLKRVLGAPVILKLLAGNEPPAAVFALVVSYA